MSTVSTAIEALAREICTSKGKRPDECIFGSARSGVDSEGNFKGGMTCSRYAWEDHISEALAIASARAEGYAAGHRAGQEAMRERAADETKLRSRLADKLAKSALKNAATAILSLPIREPR